MIRDKKSYLLYCYDRKKGNGICEHYLLGTAIPFTMICQIFLRKYVKKMASMQVAMLTKGGMGFDYHAENEQTRFNILFGDRFYPSSTTF